MSALITVGYFLTNLLFTLVLFLLWSRVILRYFRISALHPVCQMIYTLTNPLIWPIDRLIFGAKPAPGRYDWSTIAMIVVIELFKYICVSLIVYQAVMPVAYLLLFVAADLIVQPCNIFFYLILIQVIMSWVNPRWSHPLAQVIYTVTAPLLNVGRKIIPNISGFDFSPLVILVLLQVIVLFIRASMPLPIL